MTDLTPDKLDQIEEAASALKEAVGDAWIPVTLLALVARVRELEPQVERVRAQAQAMADEFGHSVYAGNGWACGVAAQASETIKSLGERSMTTNDLGAIRARLNVEYNMSNTFTKARAFSALFPIGRGPGPCALGKATNAECEAHNTWLTIDGQRRRQCDCTTDDELVLEYIVSNDVPALIAEVEKLRAQVKRVRHVADGLELGAKELKSNGRFSESGICEAHARKLRKALGEEA